MDFTLSKELQMLQKAVREFAKKKIAPNVDEWDADHHLPYKEVMRPMGELGFFGTVIPEEYGGMGLGTLDTVIAVEELSTACLAVSVSFAASGLGAYPILVSGSEEMKQKYMPDVATGKTKAAFALTEANAGSFFKNPPLESAGRLAHVKTSVSPKLEITAILKRVLEANGPAVFFESVEGSEFPMVANMFGSRESIRLALGQEPGPTEHES